MAFTERSEPAAAARNTTKTQACELQDRQSHRTSHNPHRIARQQQPQERMQKSAPPHIPSTQHKHTHAPRLRRPMYVAQALLPSTTVQQSAQHTARALRHKVPRHSAASLHNKSCSTCQTAPCKKPVTPYNCIPDWPKPGVQGCSVLLLLAV